MTMNRSIMTAMAMIAQAKSGYMIGPPLSRYSIPLNMVRVELLLATRCRVSVVDGRVRIVCQPGSVSNIRRAARQRRKPPQVERRSTAAGGGGESRTTLYARNAKADGRGFRRGTGLPQCAPERTSVYTTPPPFVNTGRPPKKFVRKSVSPNLPQTFASETGHVFGYTSRKPVCPLDRNSLSCYDRHTLRRPAVWHYRSSRR